MKGQPQFLRSKSIVIPSCRSGRFLRHTACFWMPTFYKESGFLVRGKGHQNSVWQRCLRSDWFLSGLDFPQCTRAIRTIVNDQRARRTGCASKEFPLLHSVISRFKKRSYIIKYLLAFDLYGNIKPQARYLLLASFARSVRQVMDQVFSFLRAWAMKTRKEKTRIHNLPYGPSK